MFKLNVYRRLQDLSNNVGLPLPRCRGGYDARLDSLYASFQAIIHCEGLARAIRQYDVNEWPWHCRHLLSSLLDFKGEINPEKIRDFLSQNMTTLGKRESDDTQRY